MEGLQGNSRRSKIVKAIVKLLKDNLDGTTYSSNLFGKNVVANQVFWDEVPDYPYISINAGSESREYLPGGFKWGFLEITIKMFLKGESCKEQLEQLFEDIETLIDNNIRLVYDSGDGNKRITEDIRVASMADDEGLLFPEAIGEMSLIVQFAME